MLINKTTLHIVAGFKGAGKTTYINNNLLICGKKAAVLLNEHGAAKIREGFTVRDLKSGCPCCDGARFFLRDLQNFYYEFTPEEIIVELSSFANLEEMHRIMQHRFSLRFLSGVRYYYVINTKTISSRELISGPFIKTQLQYADSVVLTRH
ncbi:MAG: hypothetical protein J6O71_04220 [Lachnospiraceae bacterium]|nr:hypothetical protein [Lachnospiraceae bacterium]